MPYRDPTYWAGTDPAGPPQETFGGTIVAGSTDEALTRFMEARDAAMAPLLDAPGLAALYTEDAIMLHPLYGLPMAVVTGRAALEEHFRRIGEVMLSMVHVETNRTVEGRRAVWEGLIEGVQAGGSRRRLSIPAVFSLEFDDNDLVRRQTSYYSIDEARRQLAHFELRR